MNKKTFTLISGIVGGIEAIAVAVVTYINPEYATAINSSVDDSWNGYHRDLYKVH